MYITVQKYHGIGSDSKQELILQVLSTCEFVYNVPPTAKVILWKQDHGLESHQTD